MQMPWQHRHFKGRPRRGTPVPGRGGSGRGFRDGRASVRDANGKWGVIDTEGKLVVPCTNDNILLL